ncbi:hypothetical protein HDU97_005670 [Phlyctochytrium planicorne]|nr:hypothetical protein HDU97_005670 [Phlyctochytrium planicorne]
MRLRSRGKVSVGGDAVESAGKKKTSTAAKASASTPSKGLSENINLANIQRDPAKNAKLNKKDPKPTKKPTSPAAAPKQAQKKKDAEAVLRPSIASTPRKEEDEEEVENKENVPPRNHVESPAPSVRREKDKPRTPFAPLVETINRASPTPSSPPSQASSPSTPTKRDQTSQWSNFPSSTNPSQRMGSIGTAATRVSRNQISSPRLSPLLFRGREMPSFSARTSPFSFDVSVDRIDRMSAVQSEIMDQRDEGIAGPSSVRKGFSERMLSERRSPVHDKSYRQEHSSPSKRSEDDPFGFFEAERRIEERRIAERNRPKPAQPKEHSAVFPSSRALKNRQPSPTTPSDHASHSSSSPTLAPGKTPSPQKVPLRDEIGNLKYAALKRTRAAERKQIREMAKANGSDDESESESDDDMVHRRWRSKRQKSAEPENAENELVSEAYLKEVEERKKYFDEIDQFTLEEADG